MKNRLLALHILVIVTVLMAWPAFAATPANVVDQTPNLEPGPAPAVPPESLNLRELKAVDDAAGAGVEAAMGRTTKVYWNVQGMACANGTKIFIAIDGKWKGYVTRNGKFYVGTVKNCRNHSFYAKDEYGQTTWGPTSYYISCYYRSFTWSIYCY